MRQVCGGGEPAPRPLPRGRSAATERISLGRAGERVGVRGKEASRNSGPLTPTLSPTGPNRVTASLHFDRGGEAVSERPPRRNLTRTGRRPPLAQTSRA